MGNPTNGRRLSEEITQLGHTNIQLVPPTKNIHDYYNVADLFVLSSFEEGFPRVLLEAMGFALPIVCTDIVGLSEIARSEREALFVPIGDRAAMAWAMQRLLENDEFAAQLGQNALARLNQTFVASRVLPQHVRTIMDMVTNLSGQAGTVLK